MKMMTMREVII